MMSHISSLTWNCSDNDAKSIFELSFHFSASVGGLQVYENKYKIRLKMHLFIILPHNFPGDHHALVYPLLQNIKFAGIVLL